MVDKKPVNKSPYDLRTIGKFLGWAAGFIIALSAIWGSVYAQVKVKFDEDFVTEEEFTDFKEKEFGEFKQETNENFKSIKQQNIEGRIYELEQEIFALELLQSKGEIHPAQETRLGELKSWLRQAERDLRDLN